MRPGGGAARRPADDDAPVRTAETHVSILFFMGDRVYKVRKPVHFGFVDFRDRSARRADCEREVELNRRLSPDVYLGVADVVLAGEPVEHMVVMKRMPESRRLATLARHGAGLDGWLHQVAEVMATFHRGARRSAAISALGSPGSLRGAWEENFAEMRPFIGPVADPGAEERLEGLVRSWLDGRRDLLGDRAAAGRICDGHGDLQAEDIFCLDDGVRILDCLEFSEELRCTDVIADVVFLAMDLERLGHLEDARRFLEVYQQLAGDRFPASLVHHYWAWRAYVRAKVACLRAAQVRATGEEREMVGEARRLHAMALQHLERARVRLVLLGGLPGSGKSTLAAGVAAERGWTVLRTDEIRRSLGGGSGGDSSSGGSSGGAGSGGAAASDEGLYRPEVTRAVYREMLDRARQHLGRGESVILDASWTDEIRRAEARALAGATSSDLVEIVCRADHAVAVARMERRSAQGRDPSEATPEVRAVMGRAADQWSSAAVVDTTDDEPDRSTEAVLGLVGA